VALFYLLSFNTFVPTHDGIALHGNGVAIAVVAHAIFVLN
jgi:hypothetical protein